MPHVFDMTSLPAPIEFAPRDGVRFIKNVMIPMPDSVHLALDLHVPDCDGWQSTPRPLILEYMPYRKDDAPPYSGYHHYFALHGFIGARLDCRGSGASEGINTDEYSAQEQHDGYNAIEWIAQQSWCSGKIAMYGTSYGGFTALQLAALQPPHLTTIIPGYFTDDRYTDDCHYRGGAVHGYYDVATYGTMMIAMNAAPPYAQWSGENWAQLWQQHLENNSPYILQWLAHQTDGEYWRNGSLRNNAGSGYERIKIPIFMFGGWRDGYPNPLLRTCEQLQSPKKLLIGPWNHWPPPLAVPGPRIDHYPEVVRWCNYWLKGEANGVLDEPPITLWMQSYDEPHADRLTTSGYWRVEDEFPFAGSSEHMLYLGENVLQDTPDEASTPVADEYNYRPTIGICGGLWSGGYPFGLPTDQRPDEIYSLNYTGEVLEEPIEIIGRPRVIFHASSSAPVMAFVARLCDVAPDGMSALVCSGILNATRRNSLSTPEALQPGKIYELEFELDSTAWRFEPGHRIRLSINSGDFPNTWPTPYRGRNKLFRGGEYTSRLLLPIVPTKKPKHETEFKPAATPEQIYQLAPGEPPWEYSHDMLNDTVALRTRRRSTLRVVPEIEIAKKEDYELRASNRDPANVTSIGHHRWRIAEPQRETEIDACCHMQSTLDAFHVTVDLEIEINGVKHHQQRWMQSFSRDHL